MDLQTRGGTLGHNTNEKVSYKESLMDGCDYIIVLKYLDPFSIRKLCARLLRGPCIIFDLPHNAPGKIGDLHTRGALWAMVLTRKSHINDHSWTVVIVSLFNPFGSLSARKMFSGQIALSTGESSPMEASLSVVWHS